MSTRVARTVVSRFESAGRRRSVLFAASLLGGLCYVACGNSDSFAPATPPAAGTAGKGGGAGRGGTAGMGNAGAPEEGGAGGEGPTCADEDQDGVTTCELDCDDNDDEVFPGNPAGDVCDDGKDNDCDGDADPPSACCFDDDDDGVSTCDNDCDDDDDEMFPGNPAGEVCGDGKDNDCDGDADPSAVCCPDDDDDGVTTCDDDCDDDDDEMFPGNPAGEVCGDGKDNDCDGDTDPMAMCCPDNDQDGVTTCDGDCDDDDPLAFPMNPLGEICGDGIDNDCTMGADPIATCSPTGTAIGTYVSTLKGQDPPAGLGTQAAPVRTIAQGMANAVTLANGQPVFVAEGDYLEKVTMLNGVSLLGGHECNTTTCTWAREPITFVSRIVDGDTQGVLIDHNVVAPTRFDGFTVQGLSGDPGASGNTAALTIEGGTPIVANCEIIGGTVTGGTNRTSRGINAIGPMSAPTGALVTGCLLRGGDSTGATSAIALSFESARTNPAVVRVEKNTIRGGNGNYTRGADTWGAGPGTVFFDNDVFAGSVVTSAGSSFGMLVAGTIIVESNRVNIDQLQTGVCPATNFWCGGLESEGSTSTITNNVVYGMTSPMSAALFFGDGEQPFGQIIINANTLNGAGLFNPVGTSVSTALACRTSSGTNAIVGRIRNNHLDGGEARQRFGMYEQENTGDANKTCQPEAYDNNDIFFRARVGSTDNAHRRWAGGASSQVLLPTVADVNMMSYALANFTADCLLDGTSHLGSGSPCIDMGTATEAPLLDFDGDTRPMGMAVDVGADEAK